MSTLSLDELLCIFNLLDDDEDLRSLCRACQQFNALIQPRIFSRLHFVEIRYPKDKSNKSIEFRQFRQFLERSPHLARYPREVTFGLSQWDGLMPWDMQNTWDTQDRPVVIAALTGKNVRFFHLILNLGGWWPEGLKSALETFFKGTTIPLDVILTGAPGLSAFCFQSTRHLLLNRSTLCDTLGAGMIKTLSLTGLRSSGSIGPFVGMPYLTHLMLDWESPSGKLAHPCEPEKWYAELGTALANMPKLELLTILYRGMFFFLACTPLPTIALAEFQDTTGNIEAYASTIQHAVRLHPRRVSLDWRILEATEMSTMRIVERLRVLRGWHTIAFQVYVGLNIGRAMVQVATDTLLKDSDNYYVRIDEVHRWPGSPPMTELHQSTLVINGKALNAVERRVHEHVCPFTPQHFEEFTDRRKWESTTIRI
jgi:hypothetical protein